MKHHTKACLLMCCQSLKMLITANQVPRSELLIKVFPWKLDFIMTNTTSEFPTKYLINECEAVICSQGPKMRITVPGVLAPCAKYLVQHRTSHQRAPDPGCNGAPGSRPYFSRELLVLHIRWDTTVSHAL